MFGKAAAYLKGGHWNTDASALPAAKRIPLRLFRFVTMAWGAFAGHRGKLHAAALTYFTLTTVVPVLCLVLLAASLSISGYFIVRAAWRLWLIRTWRQRQAARQR